MNTGSRGTAILFNGWAFLLVELHRTCSLLSRLVLSKSTTNIPGLTLDIVKQRGYIRLLSS